MSCPSAKRMSKTRVLQTHVLAKIIEQLHCSIPTYQMDWSFNQPDEFALGSEFRVTRLLFSRCSQTLRHLGLGTPLSHCPKVMNCFIWPKNSKNLSAELVCLLSSAEKDERSRRSSHTMPPSIRYYWLQSLLTTIFSHFLKMSFHIDWEQKFLSITCIVEGKYQMIWQK